jgi:hypothetical protein
MGDVMKRWMTAGAMTLAGLTAACSSSQSENLAANKADKGVAQDSCDPRHIRNTSGYPWTFSASNLNGKNVYFFGVAQNCKSPNGPCTIPPGSDVAIRYTSSTAATNGTWYITDLHGATRHFTYDNRTCPHIDPDGKGPVVFNDPANGDIHAWAPSW